MSFSIDKKLLETNLAKLMPFIEKREDEPLHAIEIKASEDTGLTLSATNNIMGLEIQLNEIMVSEDFVTTISGKDFYERVKRFNGNDVVIEIENRDVANDQYGDIVLKSAKSRYKLLEKSYLEYQEYLITPDRYEKNVLTLPKAELFEGFKQISPAIDTNNPKLELNGGLIDIRNKVIYLASTDTRQLMVKNLMEFDSEDKQLNIPKKSIEELVKLFEKTEEEEIDFMYDENFLILSQGNMEFYSRVYSGKYPNYSRIIPSDSTYKFVFNKKDFASNLKILELEHDFALKIYRNKLSFESSDMSKMAVSEMELEEPLDLGNTDKESLVIGLDPNYVKNALKSIHSDTFEFWYSASSRPVVFKDGNYMAIVMPVLLKDK